MYKAWIRFTIVAVLFFLICLVMVLFRNKPIMGELWQEALFIISVANLIVAWIYYKRNRDEFAAGRKKEQMTS
jgi:hypothetical protein